jgi:hypothetical protein
MHEGTLSSAWTFWAKFIFPIFWISIFGVGAISLWFGDFRGRDNTMPPPQMKFIFMSVWVLGSTLILWANAALKQVRIGEHQLHISNYIREISVPFSSIIDVKQNRWLNSRPVTIYFRDATEFGDTATFMPKRHFRVQFWRIDPVVNELKQLAGLLR